jgi:hypothetical protein
MNHQDTKTRRHKVSFLLGAFVSWCPCVKDSRAVTVQPVSSLHKLTASAPGALDAFPTAPVQLRAARGEYEDFQVVISADDTPLRAPQLRTFDFKGPKSTIAAANVRLYREHFAFISQPSGNRELSPKWWPDALIPLQTQPLPDIAPRKSEVVWCEVFVPAQTPPGQYRGTLEVQSNNQLQRLPLTVRVEAVTMPAPTCRANVAVYYDLLRDWYRKRGREFSDAEWDAQKRRFYEFLLDFRLNAYDLPVAWDSPDAEKYLRDPRVRSVRLPPLDSPDFDRALQLFKRTNTLQKAYDYRLDEPSPEQCGAVRERKKALRARDARLKMCVTTHPKPSLEGAVDIWCPDIGDIFGLGHLDLAELARQRAKGRETWFYTMVEPKAPYPTWLIDDDASSVRIYGALMAHWGITGFVYSMAHGWSDDPLDNPRTFADTWGDGVLLYPSELVGGVGPMPSIRLMLLRDALEDYELVKMAEVQHVVSFEAVRELFPSLALAPSEPREVFNAGRDPQTLLRFRQQLFAAFEKPQQNVVIERWFTGLLNAEFSFGPNNESLSRSIVTPQINGHLDDATYNTRAKFSGTFSRFDGDTHTATQTRMWATRDASNLYVAVRCEQPQAGEWVAVEIAPQNTAERWRFVVTQRGKLAVERHTREGRFNVEGVAWQGAHYAGEGFWNAEFRVPLSLVGEGKPFRLNALRRTTTRSNTRVLLRAFPDAGDVTLMPLVSAR